MPHRAVSQCSIAEQYHSAVHRLASAQLQHYNLLTLCLLLCTTEQVIFADGTFMEGSTLELSADGPLREPYAVYAQGCTHWTHWAIILEEALVRMGLARAS
jgi:Methionine gamma-lyase